MFELVNHEGYIAQFRYSWIERDRPVECVDLVVSNVRVDENIEWMIGKTPWNAGRSWANGIIWERAGGPSIHVDTTNWRPVRIEKPVKKPRDGKDYTWQWQDGITGGRWGKAYFPRCDECGRYHDPTFTGCETCGECHRTGKKCQGVNAK